MMRIFSKGCAKKYIFAKIHLMLLQSFTNNALECGTDEAGRGCLAGPVNDSKQLSEKIRENLKPLIEEKAISFAVTHLEPKIIDEINILNASIKAMQECVIKLTPTPLHIIVDGNRFKPINEIPYTTIVKGDSKFLSIAAASVLAKTYRDEYMNRIHEEFPMYGWNKNKGYPTKDHREAIAKYGPTKYHRMSFRLLPEQLKLEL
jgi:ribonuclease HII